MAVDSAAQKFYDIELFKSSKLNPLLFTVTLQKKKNLFYYSREIRLSIQFLQEVTFVL